MDVMTSAEKVTKLLRAKNSSPQKVALIGSDLLQGRIPAYLPNAGQFVFTLICDRMNDFTGKDFKTWKYSPELWELWYTCWQELETTPLSKQLRSKSFTNVKILQVVADVLQKVYTDSCNFKSFSEKSEASALENGSTIVNDGQATVHQLLPQGHHLVSAMFISLNRFMETGYILVDESSAMLLLHHYTKFLLLLFEADSETEAWTNFVSTIYRMPQESLTFKLSKKSVSKYYNEILPYKLALLCQSPRVILQQTYDFLYSAFCAMLFEGESHSFIAQIKSHNEFIDPLSDIQIEFLFKESLHRLAPNDISDCEAIYSGLTKSRLTQLCTTLLTMLSKLNRTLSPQFCKNIYDNELRNEPTNWLLIGQLLSIDTDLAVSKWTQVINSAYSSDEFTAIAQNIALGFVRAREYHVFLSEVYPYALDKSTAWKTKKLFETLSLHVAEMSRIQINQLAKDFIQRKQIMPLLVLAYGLFFSSAQLQEFNQDVFTDSSIVELDNSELLFYVYCLYGKRSYERKLISDLPNKVTSYYDLCLKFRIVELSGNLGELDEKSLIEAIKLLNESEVKQLLTRWIVLIDKLPAIHQEVLNLLFSTSEEFVLSFFEDNAVVIFEHPQILRSLQNYIKTNEVLYFQKLMLSFPSIVLRTIFGDDLRTLCKKVSETPNNTEILNALNYVLQEPRHSLDVETQADYLLNLARSANNESLKIVVQMTQNVWNMHLRNKRHEDSKAYLTSFVSKLLKNLSKPKPGDLELAKCILSQDGTMTIVEADKLMEKFVKIVEKTIMKETFENQIDTLTGISLSSESSKKVILNILKQYGSEASSPETTTKLFDLAAKAYDHSHAAFVISLFVALRQQLDSDHHEELIQSLKLYIGKLPEAMYMRIYKVVFQSFDDVSEPFLCPLLDALVLMTPSAREQFSEDMLLTSSLLVFATHLVSCLDPATLLRILSFVSLSLNSSVSFTQYSVEIVLEICNSTVKHFKGPSAEEIYISAITVLSHVILNQRHRLSSRYHLVICVLTCFMEALCKGGPLSKSSAAASAFLRLLVTLCEPQVYTTAQDSSQLTSRAAEFKDVFRKEAHIVLTNFISLHLTKPFTGEVYDKVIIAIHSLCCLLTNYEIQLVTQLLDSLSRVYLQSLYSNFKDTRSRTF